MATAGIDSQGINPEIFYWGLVFGILKIGRLQFFDRNSNDDQLINTPSAGQWALFSSLASLSLVALDHTLILIDEPENTLHPRWQREYLEDLEHALHGRKNCQILLATHAPLIAASLKKDRDQLIRLTLLDRQVKAELVDAPEGWTANDILEDVFELPTTRSKELEELLDSALKTIAGGIDKKKDDFSRIKNELKHYLMLLPEDDVARNLINVIINIPTNKK